MRKKSEDHYRIVGLRKKGKSYKEIVEITKFKIDKVKYHLKAKNREKSLKKIGQSLPINGKYK